MVPSAALTTRFAADLDALIAPGAKIGIAVSGGPDSIALLLLAVAARPGLVHAATVDHGLRPEARAEADMVASLCQRIGVPHAILAVTVNPGASVQAHAREARYDALAQWAGEQGIEAVATGHHLDDQAETLLMRVSRGAGVSGLAGVRAARTLSDRVKLVRPLLNWRRAELAAIVADAGLTAADDPSNADDRYDRTRARALLAEADWIDSERLVQVAANARDAEEALAWTAAAVFEQRSKRDGDAITVDPDGLPREIKRRMLLAAIANLGAEQPPGPQLMKALDALEAGEVTTLAGLKLEGGPQWLLSPAPPRRPFTP